MNYGGTASVNIIFYIKGTEKNIQLCSKCNKKFKDFLNEFKGE